MTHEQLLTSIKLYLLIGLAKSCELLAKLALWTNEKLFAADIWLTAKACKHRR